MHKTKSIKNIEERMEGLDPSSLRYQVLESARRFKSSWIELGRHLFQAHKDRMFKEWGYLTFEAYCSREIGVRQSTALKLLRSYSFLEREEPEYLKGASLVEKSPSSIPSYESVNALRLAKASGRLTERAYGELKGEVLDHAGEDGEIKKKIRYVLRSSPEPEGPEEKGRRRQAIVRRFLTQCRAAKSGLAELGCPAKVLKEIDTLVDALEDLQE